MRKCPLLRSAPEKNREEERKDDQFEFTCSINLIFGGKTKKHKMNNK